MNELTLSCGESYLRFDVSYETFRYGWCQLYFYDGGKELKLGADSQEAVFSKLITGFISTGDKKRFTYSGLEMFTVMNLMDSHAVIAGREQDGALELIFISTQGEVTPLMRLTDETKAKWITEIISFLTRNNDE